MQRTAFLIALAIAGCTSPRTGGVAGDDGGGTDPGNDGHDQIVAPLQGMETQGQDLLGAALDDIEREPGYHLNITTAAKAADGSAVTVTFDGSAALRSDAHRGADPFFEGMTLVGSAGGQIRISSVARGGYDLALYRIALRTGPDSWTDPCHGGDAIPLAGKWQQSGFHERAPDRFSFACADSVAYKCSVWGFLAGSDDTALGWRAHQACTRMARGDYCADGVSHTRPGTRIQIYDFAGVTSPPPQRFDGVASWPPDPDRLFFESAWNDGAHPASCLSRLRWQSLPLGPLCGSGGFPELRDPRADTGVRFCEDIEWPAPGTMPAGALLFNRSRYTDLELQLWQDGTDLVSTVRGLYDQPIREPFPNSGSYTYVGRDGMLIRSLRDGLDPADFVEVHVYGKPGDKVVAATAPADGFTDLGREGFVRRARTPRAIAFDLYFNAATQDYLSTAITPPVGYERIATIGYVMPAESQ
jgi:hypothetical protein